MRLLSFFGFGRRGGDARDSRLKLTDDEFLRRVRPGGLDWSRSVDELQAAYGVAPCETTQAVYLPPTTVLTPFPIRFFIRVPGMLDPYPPTTYTADIDLHGDAKENLHAVGGPLTDLLGKSNYPNASSNVIGMGWKLGVFTLELFAWPRHLNKPDTRTGAWLKVSSGVSHCPPDDTLLAVPGLPAADRLRLPPAPPQGAPGWRLSPTWPLTRANFTARQNPPGAFDACDDANPLIWRDAAAGRVGVSGRTVSLAFDRARCIELQEHHLSPGRGNYGYRDLDIVFSKREFVAGAPPHGAGISWAECCQVNLARVVWDGDITPLTETLAAFWNLPVTKHYGMND